MIPSATALATGDAAQNEQVGVICSTKAFCTGTRRYELGGDARPDGVCCFLVSWYEPRLSANSRPHPGYRGSGTNNVTCEDASADNCRRLPLALLEPPGTRCLLQCQRARQRTGSRGRETARRSSDPLPTKYGHVA